MTTPRIAIPLWSRVASLYLLLTIVFSTIHTSTLFGQNPSTPLAGIHNHPDVRSLQVSPEGAAQRSRPAVFQIGHPGIGHATAVLVSRRHRLLATAAHVADEAFLNEGMLAVADGTFTSYRVDKIWYHPGVLRRFDDGLSLPSMDPNDGGISFPTIDIAILHLAEDEVALPAECVMATDKEVMHLTNEKVAFLGFPGATTSDWPTSSRKAKASIATGIIEGLFAFRADRTDDETAPMTDRYWLRATAKLGPGASGGPLFLENGHVAGLYSGTFGRLDGTLYEEFVRSDAIREALAFHGLDGAGPGSRNEMEARRGVTFDPRPALVRRAVHLVHHASVLANEGRYRQAGEECNEAIRLVPHYAQAYLRRCEVYLRYCSAKWSALSGGERRRFATFACADVEQCIKLMPNENIHQEKTTWEWFHVPELFRGYAKLFLALSESRPDKILEDIQELDVIIATPGSTAIDDARISELVNCRAHCRYALGDFEGARKDFDETVRLNSTWPRAYLDRARFWERRNRPDLAAKDRDSASRLANSTIPSESDDVPDR